MKCGQCGEHEAVIHLTHVVEGEAKTMGLCESCAAEKGIQTPSAAAATPLGGFLSALWKGAGGPVLDDQSPPGQCPGCGGTWESFRETGRLGCGECWSTFEGALRTLLRRYHGSSHHLGRRHTGPAMDTEGEPAGDAVQHLREQLKDAVEHENFELAAELRDRLKEYQ